MTYCQNILFHILCGRTKFRCAILSESDKVFHRMVLSYLRDSDYEVDMFNDQASAISSIGKCRYSLLFVDMDMAGLDVFLLLSHTHHICPETSIIFITDNEKMDIAMQVLKLGAADILVKPIDLFYLDAALEKSLRLYKLIMENRRALKDIKETQYVLAELKYQNSQLVKENESLKLQIQLYNHPKR